MNESSGWPSTSPGGRLTRAANAPFIWTTWSDASTTTTRSTSELNVSSSSRRCCRNSSSSCTFSIDDGELAHELVGAANELLLVEVGGIPFDDERAEGPPPAAQRRHEDAAGSARWRVRPLQPESAGRVRVGVGRHPRADRAVISPTTREQSVRGCAGRGATPMIARCRRARWFRSQSDASAPATLSVDEIPRENRSSSSWISRCREASRPRRASSSASPNCDAAAIRRSGAASDVASAGAATIRKAAGRGPGQRHDERRLGAARRPMMRAQHVRRRTCVDDSPTSACSRLAAA